ncbi:hypothetical protein BC567DRAFT_40626 [Phyllosticta citribraziliensis]
MLFGCFLLSFLFCVQSAAKTFGYASFRLPGHWLLKTAIGRVAAGGQGMVRTRKERVTAAAVVMTGRRAWVKSKMQGLESEGDETRRDERR